MQSEVDVEPDASAEYPVNFHPDQMYVASLVDNADDKLFIGDSKGREFYMNEDEFLMLDTDGQFATPYSPHRLSTLASTTPDMMMGGDGQGGALAKGLFDHWPTKHESVVEGDLILGGLMMVHEREDSVTCGPIMPQGGIQALEAMLYTLDRVNEMKLLDFSLGAHILDDCDKDTYGLEMAVDFIKGTCEHNRAPTKTMEARVAWRACGYVPLVFTYVGNRNNRPPLIGNQFPLHSSKPFILRRPPIHSSVRESFMRASGRICAPEWILAV